MFAVLDVLRLKQCERDCRALVAQSESELRHRTARRHVTILEASLRRNIERENADLLSRLTDLFEELSLIANEAEDEALRFFESKCQLSVNVNAEFLADAYAAREGYFELSVVAVYESWWRMHAGHRREAAARLEIYSRHCCNLAQPLLDDFCSSAEMLLLQSQIATQSIAALRCKSLFGLQLSMQLQESIMRFDVVRQRLVQIDGFAARRDDGMRLLSLVESDCKERRAMLLGMEQAARRMLLGLEGSSWSAIGDAFLRSSMMSICAVTVRGEYQQRLLHVRHESAARSALSAHATMLRTFFVSETEEAARRAILDKETGVWESAWGDAGTVGAALAMVRLAEEESLHRARVAAAEKLVIKFELAAAEDDRLQVELSASIQLEDVLRMNIENDEDDAFVEICTVEEISWREAPRRSISAAEGLVRCTILRDERIDFARQVIHFLPIFEHSARFEIALAQKSGLGDLHVVVTLDQEAEHRRTLVSEEGSQWEHSIAPAVARWYSLGAAQLEEQCERRAQEQDALLWVANVGLPRHEQLHRIGFDEQQRTDFCVLGDLFLRHLHAGGLKFGAAATHIRAHDALLQQAMTEREGLQRGPIADCCEREWAALVADHEERWRLLVALRLCFRREETNRRATESEEDSTRRGIIASMIAACELKCVRQQAELQSLWQAKRIRLHSDVQDTYVAMMRDTAFELFFLIAVQIAELEVAEFAKIMKFITSEVEFLSQFLFYGLRLSDGRFDVASHEKSNYNCLRVVDTFPPAAPHILPGDVLMSVNGVPSVSLKAMRKAISLFRPTATFTVARDNGALFNISIQGTFKAMSRAVSVTSYTAEGYM
jgi:hypothetical protein